MNPLALDCARNMSRYDALAMATLESPAGVVLEPVGRVPFTGAELWHACRSLTYVCCYCDHNLPVSEFSRDSAGAESCEFCQSEGELENSLSDGYITGAEFELAHARMTAERRPLLSSPEQVARDRR
jgi:hypothetical protein